MDKKIFPGGEAQKQRAAARREKAALQNKRTADAEKRKQLLKNMGAATRLLVVRRGFANFAAGLLLAFGAGSAYWGISNIELSGAERTSYADAVRRAYDVTTLTDGSRRAHTDASGIPDGLYTLISMLMILVAGAMARVGAKRDMHIAAEAVEYLKKYIFGNQLNSSVVSALTGLSNRKNEKLHPICRAVVKEMASKNPVLFDRLLNGYTSNVTRDYAISVISGYLESHPDDFWRVLDAYDADSLPKSILREYGTKTR